MTGKCLISLKCHLIVYILLLLYCFTILYIDILMQRYTHVTYWYNAYTTSYVPNYCNPSNPSFSVIRGNFGPFHFELSTICCTCMNNKRCLTLFLTIYGVRGKFENFKEDFVNTNFFVMSFLSIRTPTSSWLRPKVNYNTRCICTWSYSSVATSPPFHMWTGADLFPEVNPETT
jgi:hypothetical protein